MHPVQESGERRGGQVEPAGRHHEAVRLGRAARPQREPQRGPLAGPWAAGAEVVGEELGGRGGAGARVEADGRCEGQAAGHPAQSGRLGDDHEGFLR